MVVILNKESSESVSTGAKTIYKNLVKFAWQVGLGFTLIIISNISVDAGVNYQSKFYDDDAMNTGFEYTFGIGYVMGN
jgi:outer membrane autotransporter protein